MSSANFTFEDLSASVPDASSMRIGIVVAEWNREITNKLAGDAFKTLIKYGVKESNITVKSVPGSFELIYGCSQLAKEGLLDAIIAIGCVIRGDTPHFDYICDAVTQGVKQLNIEGTIPVVFGLLTVNNMEQAKERTGGRMGNKGEEFAVTAIKMADFAWQLQK